MRAIWPDLVFGNPLFESVIGSLLEVITVNLSLTACMAFLLDLKMCGLAEL